MMKPRRVLTASSDELAEQLFRNVIEGGGHRLTISQPWKRKEEFIEEAKSGEYDVVIVTNLGLPLDYSLGLVAPLRQFYSAKVIVMSGAADQEYRERAIRQGVVAFYKLPISGEQILKSVEAAAK